MISCTFCSRETGKYEYCIRRRCLCVSVCCPCLLLCSVRSKLYLRENKYENIVFVIDERERVCAPAGIRFYLISSVSLFIHLFMRFLFLTILCRTKGWRHPTETGNRLWWHHRGFIQTNEVSFLISYIPRRSFHYRFFWWWYKTEFSTYHIIHLRFEWRVRVHRRHRCTVRSCRLAISRCFVWGIWNF